MVLSELIKYFNQFWNWQNITALPADSAAADFIKLIFISACTIIAAVISYELFEKNILKLKKYFPYLA